MENRKKQYVIFGCSQVGKNALAYLGKENVFCFADNNYEGEVCGKKVVSFETLKNELCDYKIVIATGISHACEVKDQLESNGIYDYEIYEYMKQGRNYGREAWAAAQRDKNRMKEQKKKDGISVEFYLTDAFEIFHFMPIYEVLRIHGIHAVFVAEDPFIHTAHEWFDYEETIKKLQELDLEYRETCDEEADVAFTIHRAEILKKYKKTAKIHLAYGVGLDRGCFGLSDQAIKGFDYKLVHGMFQQEKSVQKNILDRDHIKIIGCPKHYDLQGKMIDREAVLKELDIKTTKPIIGYFPTWDENSSIVKFKEHFKGLRDDFFVVTKPHHCTYRLKEKEQDLKSLYDISDIVLDGNYDFEKAAMIGDINICDAKSGAALETCLINKRAKPIFLSLHERSENYFIEELYEMASVVDKPEFLKSSVEEVLKEDTYQTVRNKKMEQFYDETFNDIKLWHVLEEILGM